MKKCSQCGAVFPDNYTFCPGCGIKAPEYPTTGGRIACVAKGVLFVILFMVVQFAASFVYTIYATIAVMSSGNLSVIDDPQALTNAVLEMVERNTSALSIAIYVITVLAILIIFAAKKRKFTESVGINSFGYGAIPFAVLVGIALNYFVVCAMAITPVPQSWIDRYDEIYSFMGEGNVVLEFVSVAILAPIVEEIVFRGLCYRYARKGFRPIVAALISGVVFGIAHGNAISFVYTTLLGVVLAYAYEKSGSIIPSILIHIGFNAGSYLVDVTLPDDDIQLWMILVILAASAALSALFCALLFKFSKKTVPEPRPDENFTINVDPPSTDSQF